MIKLTRYGTDWMVACPSYSVFTLGSFAAAMKALRYCGVEEEEIDIAIDELYKNNHNVADFGINKCFTYTCREVSLEKTTKVA